jgi:FlgD Ig-like domain
MFRFVYVYLILGLTISGWSQNAHHVYFNEIRANDAGLDNREFIELIGPAGTNITGFRIAHRNGAANNDGEVWSTTIGNFTLPNDATDINGEGLGFYILGDAAVPNVDESTGWTTDRLLDATAGLILYDASNNIIDAVAWGSAGDLTIDDPGTVTTSPPTTANTFLAVTPGDDAGNNSMEAPNNVLGDDGTGWTNTSETSGTLNSGQTGDVSLPVSLSSFEANIGANQINLRWVTESETNNLGFDLLRSVQNTNDFVILSSYQTNPDLQGQGNTNILTEYSYIDNFVDEDVTYWYKLVDVDYNGVRTEHGPISATLSANNINGFSLHQNYPNPFNPSTTIRFSVPNSGKDNLHFVLSVFNNLGQEVTTIFDGPINSGNDYVFSWDGRDNFGRRLASGVYTYSLRSQNFVSSKKMILLK